MLIDTDALPMPQERFVKIVDTARIMWQQGLQERVRLVRCHLLANQSQVDRDAMDVYIYPQTLSGLLIGRWKYLLTL